MSEAPAKYYAWALTERNGPYRGQALAVLGGDPRIPIFHTRKDAVEFRRENEADYGDCILVKVELPV